MERFVGSLSHHFQLPRSHLNVFSSWSKINGNGTTVWGPDALLTPTGKQQAANVSAAWKTQAAAGVPLPQSFYSSPFTRSADTLNITWGDFVLNRPGAPVPVVIEGLRETIVRVFIIILLSVCQVALHEPVVNLLFDLSGC